MSVFTFNKKRVLPTVIGAVISVAATAAEKAPAVQAEAPGPFSSVLFIAMLSICILLMLGIVAMAEMVKAGAAQRNFRRKKEKQEKDILKTIAFLLMISAGGSLYAQDATGATPPPYEAPFNYWGMGATVFYSMFALIFVEAIIFYVLYRTGITLLRSEAAAKAIAEKRGWFMRSAVMKSMTEATTPEEEAALMMDHDYDGIRELDNNLPAWWKYGFYLTILVSVVYLVHYHVLSTGPSSEEEYANELIAADEQIAEYRKSAANLVDENSVVRLTDDASISAGQSVYITNCTPCHGQAGEGKEGLGPNLTDDYWIHSGGTSNIFKSIKYGWTEKGMKSWEQDLKPLEIQQIVSWIQSIRGSNPENAKAPEGELYVEEGESPLVSDSPGGQALKIDSAQRKPVADSVRK